MLNDDILFIIIPKLAPILIGLSWLSRKPWMVWAVFIGILPACLYFSFYPGIYGVGLVPLILHPYGAKAWREQRTGLASACFAGIFLSWLAWIWWWTQLRLQDYTVEPL